MRSGTVAKLWKPAAPKARRSGSSEIPGSGDRDPRERGQDVRVFAEEVAEEKLVVLGVEQPDGDAVAPERLLDDRAAAGEELGQARGGGRDLHQLVAGPHRRLGLGRGQGRRHLRAKETEGRDVGRRDPGTGSGDHRLRRVAHPKRDGPLEPRLLHGLPGPVRDPRDALGRGRRVLDEHHALTPGPGQRMEAPPRGLAVEAGRTERGDHAVGRRESLDEHPVAFQAKLQGGQAGQPLQLFQVTCAGRHVHELEEELVGAERRDVQLEREGPARRGDGRDLVEGGLGMSAKAAVAAPPDPDRLARGEEGLPGLPQHVLRWVPQQRACGPVHVGDGRAASQHRRDRE
jgi:hypothetical protein